MQLSWFSDQPHAAFLPTDASVRSNPVTPVWDLTHSTPIDPSLGAWGRAGFSTTAIAFIDSTLADYQTLAAGVTPGTAVYVLDPMQDAIAQITRTLQQHTGLTSVHILSHGSAGHLQLGNTLLDAQGLETYQAALQSWAAALTDEADILLYGCEVGAGTVGDYFLQRFAALTSADLAASNNITGSALLGGDWELEIAIGTIEAGQGLQATAQDAYQYILPATLLSQTTGGTQGTGDSWTVNTVANDWASDVANAIHHTVSDDGRYVLFTSTAPNLAGTDTNGNQRDIFLRDRDTGETILVSSRFDASTTAGEASSFNPVMSADGRYVAFTSTSPDLVADDPNGYIDDVFLWDRETRQTVLISLATDGGGGHGQSYFPSISDDGKRIVFTSYGDLLRDGDYTRQIYLYDWTTDPATGTLSKVSVNNAGVRGDKQSGQEYPAIISGNGRYVVFQSAASNLIDLNNDGSADPDLNDDTLDIFVRDLQTNQTILVNINSNGTGNGNAEAIRPTISDNGQYVSFISSATNLMSGGTAAGINHAYVRDIVNNTTQLISVNDGGVAATGWSSHTAISGNGRYVAFTSDASNLAPGDTNGSRDVFVRDLVLGTTTLVSVNQNNTGTGNGGSDTSADALLAISYDGRYIAFASSASDLVPNDTNGVRDVFLRDLVAGTTTLLSENSAGTASGNGASNFAAMNRTGHVIVFTSAASDLVLTDTNGVQDVFAYTINQLPIAVNDSVGTNEDTLLSHNLLTNDTDPDHNTPLTANLVTDVSHGTLTLNPDGTFNYLPDAEFSGTDSFTYYAVDSLGGQSETATVTVSVTAVNDAPIALNNGYTLGSTATLNIPATGILANDTDVDTPLGNLSASLVADVTNGTLTLNPDGSFNYTPDINFVGTDSFTYRANDGTLDSNLSTVNLTVTFVPNALPIPTNDSFGTNEETSLNQNVLTNDTDPDGNVPLTAHLVSTVNHGTLTLNPDGTFNYTPDANFSGTDRFTYYAVDHRGGASGTATVNLSVTAVNDAPIGANDAYTLFSATALSVPQPGVLGNDTDVDTPLANLSATLGSPVTSGTLTLNSDGSFTYTPEANFTGIASFTYRATDGTAASDLVTVTLNVIEGVNLAPIATNDTAIGNEDSLITGNVLTNDTDSDGHTPLAATLINGPTHGTLTLNSTGTFNYTPNANYNGTDTFTYIAQDTLGANSNTATVTLTVNPVNDAPTFTVGANQSAMAGSGTKTVNNWATGFMPGPANEASQTVLSYGIASNSNPALFTTAPTISPTGTLIYTPSAAIASPGTAVLGVTVRDSGGTASGGIDTSPIQFFTVTILPQPSLSITGSGSQNEGNTGNPTYTFTVSLSASSIETVSVNYNTADGSATTADNDYIATTGTLVFLPGETSKAITVKGVGDTKLEPTETFTVNLTAPLNAQLATSSAVGTLINDDVQPTITIGSVNQRENNSGFSNFVFAVSLSNPTSQTVSVSYTTTDGTAKKSTSDYFDSIGTLIFAPGETSKTISVIVAGDTKVEGNETFAVNLSNPVNSTLATMTATGTIINDDSVVNSDFNGDGVDDIVWRNYQTGENMVWLMNGSLATSTLILPSVTTNWVLEGVGDFNGDKHPDLLWREYGTGQSGFWLMNNAEILSMVSLVPAVGPNWIIEGVADLNGDGNLDIFWRDSQSGHFGAWYMNGTTYISSTYLGHVPISFVLDGFGDLNNDGQIDLIWRYAPTGAVGAWLMFGSSDSWFYNAVPFSAPAMPGWGIVDVGDYNRDGKTDIVWRNYANGTNYIWFMNDTTTTGQVPLNTLGSGWEGV